MGLRETIARNWPWQVERSYPDPSYFTFDGNQYPYGLVQYSQPNRETEEIDPSFVGYVQSAYKANGVVAACMLARESLFSEARFQWRSFTDGRPGKLFGTTELALLEEPWPNGTTGDLLLRMEQDSSLDGSFYARRARWIQRMRPDWVTILIDSAQGPDHPTWALDAEIIGYAYHPGGRNSGAEAVLMERAEVCQFTPRPDPLQRFAGLSLLSSALREIGADQAATTQKTQFFEGGGPNVAMTIPVQDPVEFAKIANEFRQRYAVDERRWLVMQPGAEFQTIGSNMEEMAFHDVQGAGETRIAAALGVPPVIVGLSEGLKAATYSNYGQAMRRFADLTARPWWRNAAGSLQTILERPSGASLWYDDRDIPALKDDITARAEVQTKQASAAKQYIDAGYTPDSVTAAINADDMNLLEHSGLVSVQLQPPGTAAPEPATNGTAPDLADQAATILEGVKK